MTPMRDQRGGEIKGLRNLTQWKGPVDPEPGSDRKRLLTPKQPLQPRQYLSYSPDARGLS